MKCIRHKKTDVILRMDDEKASLLMKTGDYKYAKKSAWKDQGRNYA